MRVRRTLIAPAVAVALAAGISACGGSSSKSSSGGGGNGGSSGNSTQQSVPLKAGEDPTSQTLTGKKGGTLTVLSNEDFEHLDPGEAYYSLDYDIVYATNRPLFSYKPNTSTQLSPDLATTIPTTSNGGITDGGKTITVHIRKGVYFSPPVNRMVTSKDVAFALERGANPKVGNAYWPAYFGAQAAAPIVGSTAKSYAGGPLSGIQTPNDTTIVFHLTKAGGQNTFLDALSLPLSAPLPASFVAPLDKKSPTTYGSTYLVSTGPYMVKANAQGKIQGIGYQPGKSDTLVRNPRWNPKTDYRPAYLNQINFDIGGDSAVIGQQVLKGSHEVQLDTVSQNIVKQAYQQFPSQITFTKGAGTHYLNLNNAAGPFKNVWLRRAVYAGLNREAIVKARGGALVASPMTHFIYPGVSGFSQAGGYAGPQVAWNKNVNGDMTEAHALIKKAGYSSGKYTGKGTVQVVGGSGGNSKTIVQIVNNDLTALGFKTRISLVDQATMYSKYCGVPKAEIDACPTAGWIRDFADPLSVLLVPFYGPSIVPTNNSNWGQVNDPQINAAMAKASLIADPTKHNQAWANVDKMLVDKASAVPEEFDKQANIEAKNVQGVNMQWNEGTWDLDFTSLK